MPKGYWLLALAALLAVPAIADHLPDNKVARGKPDSVLCGIDVQRSSVQEAVKLLGNPTPVPQEKGDLAKRYVVKRDGITLEVGTDAMLNPDNTVYKYYVAYVDVRGTKAIGQIGKTGRGLLLGGTVADVRAIYGNRYVTRTVNGIRNISIEWKDTTSLIIELDANGRINHMTLSAPE